ncbi:hypothetical protein C0Q70_17105 [Pomacea canaliculata]|uniref:Hexosyltransferase n=1 Tax=Pomacea canaliculata TaxID=400727 RepID=A0A2T7NRM7_POMCA|nr:uncharacterized protein LOC112573265 [Pomacea canaliculata]XP_025109259.1 uncharacterized protein LOC112573265 [Pomacea canaliculata]XP_025109260.1 uncharacterized protein LOC112573265 [Pomacea canaliculata]PVD23831.1 hypothetical protein C0Q70_17105 [Pomacea canaliculata]
MYNQSAVGGFAGCATHPEVLLVVVVRTIFAHLDRRTVIRNTWAARHRIHGHVMQTVFLFTHVQAPVEASVLRESTIFGDVFHQFDEQDKVHANLTTKVRGAAQWVHAHCPQALFVMVSEDNVVVDVHKLLPYLHRYRNQLSANTTLLCNIVTKDRPSEYFHAVHACQDDVFLAPTVVLDQLWNAAETLVDLKGEEKITPVLSRLATAAGVSVGDMSPLFAGAVKKTSILKEFLGIGYHHSQVMVGMVPEDYQGKEAAIMKHVWRVVQEHHTRTQIFNVYRAQFPPSGPHETGNVQTMAMILLGVDLIIVLLVFPFILWKKKCCRL